MLPVLFGAAALTGAFGLSLYKEWALRRPLRKARYEAAREHAASVGKPLLVVGDPGGGMTQGDYGYGDVCIDLSGAPGHPDQRGIALSLDEPLPFEDGSFVVFVCYVLEYVRDAQASFDELARVAGGPENVHVLYLRDNEHAARVYPGARWIIENAPPTSVAGAFRVKPIERRFVLEARSRARAG